MTGNPDLPRSDAAGSSHGALTYYGELLRREWQGCLPGVYQQIRDPDAFFAVLGEVIAQRIDELADHLAGDDPPGEGYLAKVARLTAARDQAKEHVLSGYLLVPPDEDRLVIVDRSHPSWAQSTPSSGNGSAIRSARRVGRDRELRGVLDRVRSQPRRPLRLSHRDRRCQARPEHQAGADLELHPDRLASRARHGVHDAAQG